MRILVIDTISSPPGEMRRLLGDHDIELATDSALGLARVVDSDRMWDPVHVLLCNAAIARACDDELAEALRSCHEPPIVVLFARDGMAPANATADGVITGPLFHDRLRRAIDEICDRRRNAVTRPIPRPGAGGSA